MSKGRIIGLISGKGGVGKTTIAINLGIALRKLGNEVTVVDADFSASNLGVHLGQYDHPIKIQQVLHGRAKPESAIFRHSTGIQAIVSSSEIQHVEPDTTNLRDVLNSAAEESDYVLVDCPPGLNKTVETIMEACDELLIVTMPTQTAGVNAAQIIEKAKEMHKSVVGTVVNMVEGDPDRELVDREVEIMTESNIMASIPYDPMVKKSLFDKTPVVLNDPLTDASIEMKELAATIDGKDYKRPSFRKLKRGFGKIKHALSR